MNRVRNNVSPPPQIDAQRGILSESVAMYAEGESTDLRKRSPICNRLSFPNTFKAEGATELKEEGIEDKEKQILRNAGEPKVQVPFRTRKLFPYIYVYTNISNIVL